MLHRPSPIRNPRAACADTCAVFPKSLMCLSVAALVLAAIAGFNAAHAGTLGYQCQLAD